MDEITAVAASDMASAAVLAALVYRLHQLGLFSDADVTGIYDHALLMLETQQGQAPIADEVFVIARKLIERHLRSAPRAEPEAE